MPSCRGAAAVAVVDVLGAEFARREKGKARRSLDWVVVGWACAAGCSDGGGGGVGGRGDEATMSGADTVRAGSSGGGVGGRAGSWQGSVEGIARGATAGGADDGNLAGRTVSPDVVAAVLTAFCLNHLSRWSRGME